MAFASFHPIVRQWFTAEVGEPTDAQLRAWDAIGAGRHTLIAAPTGSGKTLAAFLTAINGLFDDSQSAPLPNEIRVLYVSPLKALSADIDKNLAQPRTATRPGDAESLLGLEQCAVRRAHDQCAVAGQKSIRQQVERVPRVRAVIDVGAHERSTAHDEAAQRPVTGAAGKAPRARIVDLRQRTDHASGVDLEHRLNPARALRSCAHRVP